MPDHFDFAAHSRRAVLAGMACLAAAPVARAEEASAPLAHGVLEKNELARVFEAIDTSLPSVMLETPDGEVAIADLLKGRTVLMPVWAEWCVPCLIEIPDFARLQKAHGNDKFAILPVLSSPQKQMTLDVTAWLLKTLKADALTPIVERHFGKALAQTLGRKGNSYSLPCNVLIAPNGRVVAREIGLESNGHDVPIDKDDRYNRAERAAAGETQSLWGTPAGDEFAAALANGFLG